jgi:hypothetical protein
MREIQRVSLMLKPLQKAEAGKGRVILGGLYPICEADERQLELNYVERLA